MSLRDSPLGELKVPLTWTAAVALIVVAVAATAVLLSDRRETFQAEAYGATRTMSDRVLAPVGEVLSAPGRWTGAGVSTIQGYFFAVSENRRLKRELQEMRQWRDVTIALRDTNERYRTLLGLKTDPPIPMVAARVVTDSRGPFANTRLANAGKEKGVKPGNPVMSENGLVGRVIGVTDGVSRVLLLTDIASRTPVMIDRTNARAILTGDGGPNPKLDYLRGINPVKQGDRVLTSGDGGVFPRGLPVGTAVKGLDGRWRVVLDSDRAAIDFVRILMFEDFTQLVNEKELAEMPVPPPTIGAQTVGVTPAPAGTAPTGTSATATAPGATPGVATPPTTAAAPKVIATPAVKTTPPPTAAAAPPPKAAATPAAKTSAPPPKAATAPKAATPAPKAATPAPKAATPAPKAATPAPKTPAPLPKTPAPKTTAPPPKAATTPASKAPTPRPKAATPPAKAPALKTEPAGTAP